ncbi:MAG TPA: cupin domain-containing protein, partial [Polyangiales bacterium]|nr:cupin domain-containing protein [Polyangiales bacterium]
NREVAHARRAGQAAALVHFERDRGMTRQHDSLPPFLRDSLEDPTEAAHAADVASILPTLLQEPNARGKNRLVQAVGSLPLKFAPFYDSLSQIWDLPEQGVVAELTRAKDPAEWRFAGLPGLRVMHVRGGESVARARVVLAEFGEGLRFPAHRHTAPETVLVLQGAYRDSHGVHKGPGDLHHMEPGSEHAFRVLPGSSCIAASVQFGVEFSNFMVRWWAKIMKQDLPAR